MRLGRIGETELRSSVFTLLMAALLILFGLWEGVFACLLALVLHECAHAMSAHMLGYRISSITLHPFGFSARMEENPPLWDELCIAAAGPLCSLLCGVACMALQNLRVATPLLQAFGAANLNVGFVNLLPVLPLDGGRVFRACLLCCCGMPARFFDVLGFALACALLALGFFLFWDVNPSLFIMGAFLFLHTLGALFTQGERQVAGLLRHSARMRKDGFLRVRHIAVHRHTGLREAYAMASPGSYTVWHVVDDAMCTLAVADEGAMLRALARFGAEGTVSALVDPKP